MIRTPFYPSDAPPMLVNAANQDELGIGGKMLISLGANAAAGAATPRRLNILFGAFGCGQIAVATAAQML